MFQLIRAGVIGGKTVPATVADNPLVFATLTAPVVRARPRPPRPRPAAATPGPASCASVATAAPRACAARHGEDDPLLGQPLCPDCYDYASQVVWQWWAPDLWRRFTITLRRLVAKTPRRCR